MTDNERIPVDPESDKVIIGAAGEVIIPKRIRSALHLAAGTELLVETTPAGLLLKPANAPRGLRLEDLRGFLKQDGPPVPLEELCRPVDYSKDWQGSEPKDK